MSEAAPDEKLTAFYRAFLRCGGVVTLSEWSKLDHPAFEALLEAAAQVEAERAGRVAEAILLAQQAATKKETRDEILERAGHGILERGGV